MAKGQTALFAGRDRCLEHWLCGLDDFEMNVPELNNRRWTAVQLQAEYSLKGLTPRVVVHDFSGQFAVHEQRQL